VFGCGVLRKIQESNYILTKRNEKVKDPIVFGYSCIFV
jgi:hypothetical protein